jgi:ATP-dependent DNA ligase
VIEHCVRFPWQSGQSKYSAIERANCVYHRAIGLSLDGELCAVRPDGTTSFPDLQAPSGERRTVNLVYFAFDLLVHDGRDLMALPHRGRKERLRKLLRGAPRGVVSKCSLCHAIP